MQIKARRYHFTATKMATIKKTVPSTDSNIEKLEHLCYGDGNFKDAFVMVGFKKSKHKFTIQPKNSTPT